MTPAPTRSRLRCARAILALLLGALVSACAGGPAGDPHPIGAAMVAPPDRIEGANGVRLAYSDWPARGRTRAVILALHGYGDFGPSTYAAAADHWARRGIATYAYDQRGFGRNPDRKLWPGPDILISDLIAIAPAIRARHPGVPLIVVGHSMGGGVALAAAGRGLDADALVLAGPAIAGGSAITPLQRFGGWAIGTFAADRRFTGEGVVTIVPTDNVELRRRITSHPAHYGDPSGRELAGLIRVMDAAAEAAPRVTTPTLTLMGARDQILRPFSVRRVHDRIPGKAGFVLYPDGWHWLFRDRQAERVWEDVAAFALARAH